MVETRGKVLSRGGGGANEKTRKGIQSNKHYDYYIPKVLERNSEFCRYYAHNAPPPFSFQYFKRVFLEARFSQFAYIIT